VDGVYTECTVDKIRPNVIKLDFGGAVASGTIGVYIQTLMQPPTNHYVDITYYTRPYQGQSKFALGELINADDHLWLTCAGPYTNREYAPLELCGLTERLPVGKEFTAHDWSVAGTLVMSQWSEAANEMLKNAVISTPMSKAELKKSYAAIPNVNYVRPTPGQFVHLCAGGTTGDYGRGIGGLEVWLARINQLEAMPYLGVPLDHLKYVYSNVLAFWPFLIQVFYDGRGIFVTNPPALTADKARVPGYALGVATFHTIPSPGDIQSVQYPFVETFGQGVDDFSKDQVSFDWFICDGRPLAPQERCNLNRWPYQVEAARM
jgi:hypothetical protein